MRAPRTLRSFGARRALSLVEVTLGLGVLGITGYSLAIAPMVAPALAVLCLVFLVPWPLARHVLVPLGLARVAYFVTLRADFVFSSDVPGGAALAAAWAVCRQREPDEETLGWLEAKLDAQTPLRAGGVMASGLLLAARGDLDGARTMIASVLVVDVRARPPAVRRLAVSWLAADAARRGDWARVIELGKNGANDGGRGAWLLAGVAQALRLEPGAPKEIDLWLRWAVTPHRRAMLPLVRRAIEASRGAFVDVDEPRPTAPPRAPPGADALGAALALHAAVLAEEPDALRADAVSAAGEAWDKALFDRATGRAVLERGLALGAGDASGVLERTRAAVEDDLARAVLAAGIPLADLDERGEVLGRVRAELRDRLLGEIEAASDAIRRRTDDRRALPATSEWRELWNLCAVYERAVKSGGPELRRLAFVKVYPDMTTFAVWLYNDRHERPLGNVVFRWLLDEATALDDQRAVSLASKNVACGV